MNTVFLTEKEIKDNLFPLTLTRSAADIRIGIFTIREKWKLYAGVDVAVIEDTTPSPGNGVIVAANVVPSATFVSSLLERGEPDWSQVRIIQYPWHIFSWNDWAIREDFAVVTRGRHSAPIPDSVQVKNRDNIFIEEGARISHSVINAEAGPVYIGKDAEVLEGCLLRGPIAIGERAVLKMGTKIYGATTIGPYSIVGGEIKNSVMFGYSNKAHDGYLGDSVIGEWCNLGAGTSNSNMKNNVSEVRMWSHVQQEFISTGLFKCGLVMGDYSRSAINTSFNTGTTVGVCANVFGSTPVSKYVPSFSWGNDGGRYQIEKAIDDIDKWKKLKDEVLSEKEKTTLKLIFGE